MASTPTPHVLPPPPSSRATRESQISAVIDALERSVNETSSVREAVITCLSDVKDSIQSVKDTLGDRIDALEERVTSIARGVPTAVAAELPTPSLNRQLFPSVADALTQKTFFASAYDERIIHAISKRSRCIHPTLQWLCTVCVLSFVKDIPQVSSWLDAEERETYRRLMSDLSGVSGLAMIFFSKDPKDSNAHDRSRDGSVWTFVLRWVFSTMIASGRQQVYAKGNELEPCWLKSFGTATDTVRIVQDRLRDFERVSDPSSSTATPAKSPVGQKRRRLVAEAALPRGIDLPKELLSRIKTGIQTFLTQNRRQAKLYLFENLLFFIEKIQSFPDPSSARHAGYYINVASLSHAEELTPIEDVSQDSIWDVPLAKTGPFHADDLAKSTFNEEALSKVKTNFPSLAVNLCWKKDIRRSPQDPDQDHPEYRDLSLQWPVTENIHLLDLARGMLSEFVRNASPAQILRSSKLSIRALHILALGLRALVRSSMGASLTAAEKAALGSVRAQHRNLGEEIVSVYVGKRRGDDSGEQPTRSSPPSDETPQSPTGDSVLLPVFEEDATENLTPSSGSAPPPRKTNLQRIRSAKLEISWTSYLLQKTLNGATPAAGPHASSTMSATAPYPPSSTVDVVPDVLVAAASDIMNISNIGSL